MRGKGAVWLRRVAAGLACAVAAWAVAGRAPAFTAPAAGGAGAGRGAEAVALYTGPDREQRLVEGARREGRLVVYTSMSLRESQPLVETFRSWLQRRYGLQVQVDLWRATSEDVLQRIILESRAGRHEVDVVETNGPELEILKREGILGRFWSPHFADYPEGLRDPGGYWHADRINVFAQAYNATMVRASELPGTWDDLLNPRWRGRLAVEDGSWDWFATMVRRGPFGGESQALEYFHRLRGQDLQVRHGHEVTAQLLAAGEFGMTVAIYNHQIEALKRQGAPVEWFVLEPAVVRPNGAGVSANAPHPHGAVLFLDFLLSVEGQSRLNQLGRVPASPRVETRLNQGFRFVPADVEAIIDQAQHWQRVYEERVLRK